MNLGRRLGARYLVREGTPTVTGLNTVEGAVFALMGLVLAFAISGALQRFDERKQLILQETNAISDRLRPSRPAGEPGAARAEISTESLFARPN